MSINISPTSVQFVCMTLFPTDYCCAGPFLIERKRNERGIFAAVSEASDDV